MKAKFSQATLIFLILVLFLSACNPESQPGTPVPAPSTATSQPTALPVATATPQPTPTLAVAQAGTPYPRPSQPITAENADQISLLASYGNGFISDVAFSPRGDIILASTSRGLVLFDAATFAYQRQINAIGIIRSMSFNRDGSLFAAGSADGQVSLWDTSDWRHLANFQSDVASIETLQFSPDSTYLASANSHTLISIWDIKNYQLAVNLYGLQAVPQEMAFSQDGSLFYAFNTREQVRRWELPGGKAREEMYIGIDSLRNTAYAGAFSPDGEYFAAAQNNLVKIYETRRGITAGLITGFPSRVTQVVYSADGEQLAALDGLHLSIWDMSAAKPQKSFETTLEQAYHTLAFSPDGETLLLSSASPALLHLESEKWTYPKGAMFSAGLPIFHNLTADGLYNRVSNAGMIQRVAIENGSLEQIEVTLQAWNTAAFALDGSWLAAGGMTGQLQRINLQPNPVSGWSVQFGSEPILAIAISPDNTWLAASSASGKVTLLDAKNGSSLHTLTPPFITSGIEISQDGKSLLLSGAGFWQRYSRSGTQTWQESEVIAGYDAHFAGDEVFYRDYDIYDSLLHAQNNVLWLPAGRLALSPDGTVLVVSGLKLWVYSYPAGRLLTEIETNGLYAKPSFSADGSLLVLAEWDGTLAIWGLQE